jgi:hypothetical protein
MCISRLRTFIAIGVLLVLMLPAALYAQEPLWRTLLISDSTPPTGGTTEVFLQFGNWSGSAVNVDNILCITVGFNGSKSFPTDALRAISVVNGQGTPQAFSTTYTTSAAIPVNTLLLPGQVETFFITLYAERPNYQYNIVTNTISGSSPYGFTCWVYGPGFEILASDGVQIYVEL